MKILNRNEAMLSDYEVYAILSDERHAVKGKKALKESNDNVAILHSQGIPSSKYKAENVKSFLTKMIESPLTRAEKLQILNLRPSKPVDLFPIVEELESRLSEEDMDRVFEIVNETLPL